MTVQPQISGQLMASLSVSSWTEAGSEKALVILVFSNGMVHA